MANTQQSPSENIIYDWPAVEVTGDITMFKQVPQQAGNLGPNQTLSFQIASRTEFVDIQRSYLQFSLTPIGPTGNCYMNTIGASSIVGQVQETVCGTSLQFLNRYELYQATRNAVASRSRKDFITQTEGFVESGLVTANPGVELTNGSTYEFVIPCPLQTITTNKLVPLSLFPGDYLIQILLNPVSYVFSKLGTTNATSYTISNVYLCLALVTPPRELYLQAMNTLNNGGDILLPISVCRNFEQNLAAGVNISFNQIIGYYESLNAITICKRRATDITDGFVSCPETVSLDSWYIALDTERFPRNRSINAEGNSQATNFTNGTVTQRGSSENLLQIIRPFNTQLDDKTPYQVSGITSDASLGINSGFCYWNFEENSSFGSGKAVANGQFVAYLTYNPTAITAGTSDVYDVFIEYSIMLRITAGGISFNSGTYA